METIKDLQLRLLRKFRAFPPQNLPSTEFGRKLVAISSRYGFAVIAGSDNRLISVKTHELHALQANDFKELDTFPKRDMDFFNLQAEIFSIEFNSDGRVLAVAANTQNGPFVYVFDGFTFYPSYSQQPFPLQSIRLGENNAAKITTFEWNPCIPEVFATSTTDGLGVYQFTLNNPKSFGVMGAIPLKVATTCLSWSPKGKELAIGDANGCITQLKPELVPVRRIEAPTSVAELDNPPYKCAGICWLSNTEWAVVHTSTTTNYLNLSLLTAKKNIPPAWESWSGVLPPLSDPTLPRSVTFLPLFDWQFILATSTCHTNAVAFGYNGVAWKPWELPEPFIINTPLSTTHKDTFIMGAGYDFTATSPVVIERDGTEVPPQPIIYTLTSDGVLLLYHVASLNRARPSLNKPIEPCDLNVTKNGDQPMGYQPRADATNLSQSFSTITPTDPVPTREVIIVNGTTATGTKIAVLGGSNAKDDQHVHLEFEGEKLYKLEELQELGVINEEVSQYIQANPITPDDPLLCLEYNDVNVALRANEIEHALTTVPNSNVGNAAPATLLTPTVFHFRNHNDVIAARRRMMQSHCFAFFNPYGVQIPGHRVNRPLEPWVTLPFAATISTRLVTKLTDTQYFIENLEFFEY